MEVIGGWTAVADGGAVDLDHFEGRGWAGWHHNVALVSRY